MFPSVRIKPHEDRNLVFFFLFHFFLPPALLTVSILENVSFPYAFMYCLRKFSVSVLKADPFQLQDIKI